MLVLRLKGVDTRTFAAGLIPKEFRFQSTKFWEENISMNHTCGFWNEGTKIIGKSLSLRQNKKNPL